MNVRLVRGTVRSEYLTLDEVRATVVDGHTKNI
jgi:hypothetical protein